ncbi:MAG: hypothetical protein H0W96_04035 [Solirubrobacterales bacterium]|nr:hypothetical protein [Solirubrobacterales bacterium]
MWLSSELPYTAFAGDWLFAESLYGPRPAADAGYVQEILRDQWRLQDASIARLLRLRTRCEPFLADCLSSVPWERHDIVGFTSTFEQNLASLALARRVKARHPDTMVVFGGANWEGEMGQELHRCFPFVDAVCSGEADESFPAMLAAVDAGTGLASVHGIVYRDAGRSIATKPAPIVRDLDALPVPDFDPWMAARAPVAAHVPAVMLIETGRGCWWGAKSHCTLIDDIWFLEPPSGWGPVRMDRFSPYHSDPEAYDMVDVRPLAPYRYLYPFDEGSLLRLAYYFDYDHADGRDPRSAAAPVLERVERWGADRSRGGLWVMHEADARLVVDERPGLGPRAMRLHGWQSIVYDACDRPRTVQGLARMTELSGVGATLLAGFLDACVAAKIMLRSDDRYLALAVTRPARAWEPAKPAMSTRAAA